MPGDGAGPVAAPLAQEKKTLWRSLGNPRDSEELEGSKMNGITGYWALVGDHESKGSASGLIRTREISGKEFYYERLDGKGKWVLDFEVARHLFGMGDNLIEPVTEEEAARIRRRLLWMLAQSLRDTGDTERGVNYERRAQEAR